MDIFTTVLTRVVPVPIKPASLKVKALLKEAGASKLKEDPDHLENHDYYFGEYKLGNNKDKQKESEQDKSSDGEQTESTHVESTTIEPEDTKLKSIDKKHAGNADESVSVSKDGIKHLDLYV